MNKFNVKRQREGIDASENLTVVNIEGEQVGFTMNRKTGEPVAYKKDAEGNWVPETAVNSKKLLHAMMANDPVVKKQIIETTKTTTQTQPIKKDTEVVDRQPEYDVRNEHKTKTHEKHHNC